jgi:hypothetical protein
LWLTAAVFGSVLTLASFVKVIHAVFLGQKSAKSGMGPEKLGFEIPALILLPLACVIIGIFPEQVAYPVLNGFVGPLAIGGLWQPQLAGILMVAGIIAALLLYYMTKTFKYRTTETYIGGENLTSNMRVSGVQFYSTIENLTIFNKVYELARKGIFDIYEIFKGASFFLIEFLRWLHTGVLSLYILWVLVGSIIIFYVMLK